MLYLAKRRVNSLMFIFKRITINSASFKRESSQYKLLFLVCFTLCLLMLVLLSPIENITHKKKTQSSTMVSTLSSSALLKQAENKRQMIAALQSIRMHNVMRDRQNSTIEMFTPNSHEPYHIAYDLDVSRAPFKEPKHPSPTIAHGW